MAQKRERISERDMYRLRRVRDELGSENARRLLSGRKQRLMRPERLSNLTGGRGKLQPWERERIDLVLANLGALGSLQSKREDQPLYNKRKRRLTDKTKETATGKALRDWLLRGKEADIPYSSQSPQTRRRQQQAIAALYFLGVEPNESETPYVRKV